MKKLTKERRDRLILVVLGTVVCVFAIWYLVIKTQKNALERVQKQTLEEKGKVANAERLVTTTAEIQKKLALSTQELKNIEDGMASGDMYSWIILTINKFRADRKVEIPQFSREVPSEVGILPKCPYRAALFNLRGAAYFHD